jgi:hypothetical protein
VFLKLLNEAGINNFLKLFMFVDLIECSNNRSCLFFSIVITERKNDDSDNSKHITCANSLNKNEISDEA